MRWPFDNEVRPFRPKTSPTRIGTATASAIQTIRTISAGIPFGTGRKARTAAAALGKKTPKTSSGHAAAAPTAAERSALSLLGTCPKSE